MEILSTLLPLLIKASLAALVLAIGLEAKRSDLVYLLQRPGLLIRAVVAISVVVPIAAVIALWLLPLHPVSRVGLMLMAVAPLPPLAPGKQLKVGGDHAYVYGLFVAYAALTIVIVPLTVTILGRAYRAEVLVTPATIAKTMLVSVGAPLAVGLALQALAPKLAVAAAPLIRKLGMLLLIVVIIPLLVKSWPAMTSLVGDGTILAISFVTVAAILGGHLLGGPDLGRRGALAAAAATRHPGIALMLATANYDDRRVVAAILMVVLVSLVLVGVYQVWLKRTAAREAVPGVPASAE